MKAGLALLTRRIERKARRAAAAAKRSRKPTAAELVRRFRMEVQGKLLMRKKI